jgi:hypothetical protein
VANKYLFSLACTLFLFACIPQWGNPKLTVYPPLQEVVSIFTTKTPFQPEVFIPTVMGTSLPTNVIPFPTPVSQYLWISPTAPLILRQEVMLSGLSLLEDPGKATVHLNLSQHSNPRSTVWIYALVAPFPTTLDNLSLVDLKNAWAGATGGFFAGRPLLMDVATIAAFSEIWGAPATGSVKVAQADKLIDIAWAERPSWGIIPFEELDPHWKVISVDGLSPLHNDFNPGLYPLKIYFELDPPIFTIRSSNRDPDKLTVLAMTGTTALVRATADQMENHGILYPGEEIRSVLRAADITHISNEVPFMADCPTPDPWTESLRFCSDPRYIDLLEDIGTDVVELTGNHVMDYGPEPFLKTLEMYKDRSWLFFGGGSDLQDSLQPALLENHGNKLAFIGCNFVGPPYDWATKISPGSAPCDFPQLKIEITKLRTQGYIPILTFQYSEYYQPFPTFEERDDFSEMVSAGAVIVSGSQAHMPASMEFFGESFVHYGLGNLFFDQMFHLMPDGSLIDDTRDVFVDRHVFYDGHYINTELLTYIIEDYARPRLMTGSERLELLNGIFSAAGW